MDMKKTKEEIAEAVLTQFKEDFAKLAPAQQAVMRAVFTGDGLDDLIELQKERGPIVSTVSEDWDHIDVNRLSVKDFKVGDVVAVACDIAGMVEGDVGMVTDIIEEPGMVEIRLSETLRHYNMLPEHLEHVEIA